MDFDALNEEPQEEEKGKGNPGHVKTTNENMLESAKRALRDKFAAPLKEMSEKVAALKVCDEPSLALATEYRSGVRKIAKEVEKTRDGWIKEEKEWVNSVRSLAKTVLDPLGAMDLDLKNKQAMGHAEIRRQQREAEAKMEKEAEELQASLNKQAEAGNYEAPLVPKMVAPTPKKAVRTESGASSSYKTVWKGIVTDADKVPREYCSPDPKKLKYAVDQGIREIAGCKIEEEIIPIQRG